MKFNLAVIQSFLAPALTPVPAALLLASKIYAVLLANVGWLAWVGALAGFVGLESLGGLTCYAAIKAYRRRDWPSFGVAAVLVGVYLSAGVSSVLWLEHSDAQILAWGFVLTVAAYIAYAMIQDVWDDEQALDKQVVLIRARTSLTNAEARKAKAELLQIPSGVQFTNPTNPTTYKTYICPYCGTDQGKAQRYSVHMRYCKEKPRGEVELRTDEL